MTRALLVLLLTLASCAPAATAPADATAAGPGREPINIALPRPRPANPGPANPGPDTPVASRPGEAPAQPRPNFAPSPSCQIHGAGDWSAHIAAMPGPGATPRLIVTGTVAAKPAARLELRLDPAVLESDPPQRIVNLIVRLPAEPTIDSLTRHQVRGEWPVTPPLGAVHIRCGGRSLASVTELEVAH